MSLPTAEFGVESIDLTEAQQRRGSLCHQSPQIVSDSR